MAKRRTVVPTSRTPSLRRRAEHLTKATRGEVASIPAQDVQALVHELHALNEALEQRVAERTRAIQTLHDVASMANQAEGPKQAMEYCLRRVALHNGCCCGQSLLPAADDPDELEVAGVWYAEDPERFRRFREATRRIRLRRGHCLTGRVFASGKPEWSVKLRRDLIKPRAIAAKALGIATAIAVPVLVGERVVAVLEFFSDRVIQPEDEILDAMVSVGIQLGRVFERASFQEHLLTVAEDVQRRVAWDLHDDVGQELTGLGLMAETLREKLAAPASRMGRLAADVAAAVNRTHDKVRRLSRELLPAELEGGLLAAGLAQLATATTAGSHLTCRLACSHSDSVFDSRIAVQLYRIAQEAVSNAIRHSGARRIRIALTEEKGRIALTIEDDGKGLPAKAAHAEGMGLRIMGYRAGLIGGKLEIGCGPGGGTQVACQVEGVRS